MEKGKAKKEPEKWLEWKQVMIDNNIPDNYTGRFTQRYENCGEYTKIYLKQKGEFVCCLIEE